MGTLLSERVAWVWSAGALAAMVVAVVLGVGFWASLRSDQTSGLPNDHHNPLETIIAANQVENTYLRRQSRMRGLVIARDSSSAANARIEDIDVPLTRLKRFAGSTMVESGAVAQIERLVHEQDVRIAKSLPLMAIGSFDTATQAVSAGVGENGLKAMSLSVDQLVAYERKAVSDRRRVVSDLRQSETMSMYGMGLVGFLILLLACTALGMNFQAAWKIRYTDLERDRERDARHAADRIRIAHEATGAGSWEAHPNGDVVWSREAATLYGAEGISGFPDKPWWMGAVHPEDLEECPWTNSHGPVGLGGSFERTFRISTASGGWRWIASRGFWKTDDAGFSVVGLDVDVTEQVANREELRRLAELLSREAAESERDKRRVYDTTTELILVIGTDGNVALANPMASRVLGDVVGRPFRDLVPENERPTIMSRAFESSEARELSIVGTSGVLTVEATIVPEEVTGRVFFFARDVTEERRRTVLLKEAEEAVRQMQKIEALGQMTGGVAHDVNNMLTPVTGYLDLIARRHPEDAKTVRMVNLALQSADKAKTLVSKLLSFSRRQQLENRVVDAAELVRGMSDLVSKAAAAPGIEFKFEDTVGAATVKVDPNQFEMALVNLAVNARDAMESGGRVTVGVKVVDHAQPPGSSGLPEGSYVVVSVSDEGVGMDEDTLTKAIEPFFSTKEMGRGTGLGLSMVHGMAAQSGGALVLRSKPGKGTDAQVWLPAVMDVPVAEASPDFGGAMLASRPLSILLVDDDEMVRRSIDAMLVEAGHRVTHASSGAEALAVVGVTDGIDLLVTDYLMPRMTGTKLVEQIREIHPGMPALIVSGYTRKVEAEAMVGVARLSKPFTATALAAAVCRAAASCDAPTLRVVRSEGAA